MAEQLFKISRGASNPAIALALRFDKKEEMDSDLAERIKNLEKTILEQGDQISELKAALSESVERMIALESEKALESNMTKSAIVVGEKSRSSSRKIHNGTADNDKKEAHIPAWKPPGSAMAKSNTLK